MESAQMCIYGLLYSASVCACMHMCVYVCLWMSICVFVYKEFHQPRTSQYPPPPTWQHARPPTHTLYPRD
jgi:hypothetical protein